MSKECTGEKKTKNSNVQCMNNMIAFKICFDNLFSSFSKGKYEVTVVNVTFLKMFYLNCKTSFYNFLLDVYSTSDFEK